jgi:hypothetical protein
MKKYTVFVVVLVIIMNNAIFSQEDDVPYLSDDDLTAIEITLPGDMPASIAETTAEADDEAEKEVVQNEMARLNTSQTIYHLLVLDRTYSPLNSDLGDTDKISILYRLKHGSNGYLIAIYTSSGEGPVFPIFPNKSRVVVNFITTRKAIIEEYVNSGAFKKFVTNRKILTQMQNVLKTNF